MMRSFPVNAAAIVVYRLMQRLSNVTSHWFNTYHSPHLYYSLINDIIYNNSNDNLSYLRGMNNFEKLNYY